MKTMVHFFIFETELHPSEQFVLEFEKDFVTLPC